MLPVKCNQHPWMKMYINVVKSPFYAVTGSDGKYEIKGLPPGDYTLAFVQEKLPEQDVKVTLAAKDSKTIDASFNAIAGGKPEFLYYAAAAGGGSYRPAPARVTIKARNRIAPKGTASESLVHTLQSGSPSLRCVHRLCDLPAAHRRRAGHEQ